MELVGTQQQGPAGRKRLPNRDRPTAEDDALNQIAREAEARLAAKRAARAEAREIRMKELERQQKEIYQVQKKYYGLDTKFGDIEQWMEDSERYTRKSRRNASASDEDEHMSVGSRGSLRTDPDYTSTYPVGGLEKDKTKRMNFKTIVLKECMEKLSSSHDPQINYLTTKQASCYSDLSLHSSGFPSKSQPSFQNGNQASLYDENFNSGSRRYSASSSRPPSEYSCYLGSGSRASSRASSARASPVVEEKPEKDFEKGIRTVSSLSAATLASLGGTSSRRGSGDTSISVDTEASIREIKDIIELKEQIQDVEGKYMQGLKEIKDSLAEAEEKYKKAMVSNAQLDNEKTNFMYQVDALKDALLELEEQLAESRRQYEEKSKDFEREKHAHAILQFQFTEVKEALKHREELLTEIRQLQQKQEGYVREITDLQETIEWKEKKIGALERQKEFFDSIRSERDDLREEVIVLKEQLKQHGIVLNSEVATNGETSSAHDDGFSSKVVPSHAPKEVGDDIIGRANGVEMKNEILENVGKRELLQNTEHEEHSEETKEQEIVQECLEIKTLHADGNAEAEKITEGKVASTLILSSELEEPTEGHSKHVSRVICSLENSGVVELRSEGGVLGDTKEVEESDGEQVDHGNIINEVGNPNKVAVPGTETNQEINTGLENTSQQQNKEKQKDILTNEAEGSNEEVFQEALEFVNNNHVAISSQLTLAEDTLTKVPSIDSNAEQPCNERENTEEKIAANDLKRQLVEDEGDIQVTDKAQWNKNEADEIKENETENVVQEQETKVVASAIQQEETCSSERIQDEFVEDQNQVEVEEIQFLSSKPDSFVEEEQNEQEIEESENNPKRTLAKKSDQKEAVFGALDAHSESEKNNEKDTMKEVTAEETIVDVVSLNECLTLKEKDLEDDSEKLSEIKSEFTDNDTLASTQRTHEEATVDSHEEEEDPTQAKDWPIEEENVDKQDETIQELPKTSQVENEVHRGVEEVKNSSKAEKEVLEVMLDIQEAACLTTQKATFSDQEEKPDSEEEEVSEEYHEAFDFDESSSGELKSTEGSDSQDKEEKKNNKKQEEAGIAVSAGQNVIGDDSEKESRDQENVTEVNQRITYQKSADKVVNDGPFVEGDEKIQQEKIKESKEDKCLETDPSFFESLKPTNELSEDTNAKLLDQSVKEVAECSSEQLKSLGSSVDENSEEVQVGRKGKGKSREDCVMS
ncbi:leucine-rich repeat flightless-interacting protein 1 isoform X3 [Tiliqua scincoides]|uniref:leucine-rich repeat flightless-interacting protein 1 isoform X3 n=1 Tax=Tiliqua scincoides TaxID=71010 RepID=UPI0034634485